MILDATAGNRTMWLEKNCEEIIYVDMEKGLEVKPQIYCDNTNTPFLPKTFDTIFYDPPHTWNVPAMFFNCKTRDEYAKLYHLVKCAPTYYGLDKYKNKDALISHLNKASKELYRILKDDGILWLKWNDTSMPLRTILVIFRCWREIMRLVVADPLHQTQNNQTYWIALLKEKGEGKQLTLLDTSLSQDSPQPTL